MANLKQFIAPDARNGGSFDVYVARINVGSGKYLAVEPLRLSVQGEAKTPFGDIQGSVQVVVPDLAPAGKCTVVLNGGTHEGCPYRTEGHALKVDISGKTELTLRDHDRSYSWVQAKGIWPVSGPRRPCSPAPNWPTARPPRTSPSRRPQARERSRAAPRPSAGALHRLRLAPILPRRTTPPTHRTRDRSMPYDYDGYFQVLWHRPDLAGGRVMYALHSGPNGPTFWHSQLLANPTPGEAGRPLPGWLWAGIRCRPS
jgi:hypothetical protein